MRQAGIVTILILLSTITLFCSGCVSEPRMDKRKFSELNRTAQDLKASLASGNPCDAPDTLRQRLVSGIEALKNKTASQEERAIIEAYSRLLTTYQDGLLLCRYRTHLSQFQFVPKGRIYVVQELDPLVEKYGLPTESHLYRPTGARWRSIDADSIKVIWESAEFQIKNIKNMVNYN
jgi:hypothetical protein